jgi:hypothetical protein
VNAVYADKTFSINQINWPINAMKEGCDQRYSNPKKTRQTSDVVASVAAAVENDCQIKF